MVPSPEPARHYWSQVQAQAQAQAQAHAPQNELFVQLVLVAMETSRVQLPWA